MSLLKKQGSTLVAFVAKSIVDYASENCELPFVLAPLLDYEEGMQNLRATLKEEIRHTKDADDVADAFVCWNREALTMDEDFEYIQTRECGGTGMGGWGQFTMNFKLYSSSMNTTEQFEVGYVTRALISHLRNMTVNFAGCDGENCSINYQVEWDQLNSLEFNKADNHYSSLNFSCTVRGSFMSLLNLNGGDTARPDPTPILEIIYDQIITKFNN